MLSREEFLKVVNGANASKINLYYEPLQNAMKEFGIQTKLRQIMFLSHIMVESGSLNAVVENLNYSAAGLRKTFGKYYRNDAEANAHARQPIKIASRVYANRMSNGNEASQEGWTYRGRGLKQLTGKYNYTLASKGLGVDLVKNPEYLTTPEGAARSAAWFWSYNNINKFADAKDIVGSTQAINGGLNGLDDRKFFYNRALKSIKIDDNEVATPSKGARLTLSILKKGSKKKEEVKKLQQALGIEDDGIFGSGTEAVLKQFQERNGLTADGVAGPSTYEILYK